MKHYLSAACIIKNEATYIEEWLEYHLLVGVQHFYIYDNDSTDGVRDVLRPYISAGIVDYIPWPGVGMQNPMCTDAIERSRAETRWLAIIDIDEFIVPESTKTISEFLAAYEDKPSVVLQWVIFGDNGQDRRGDKLVIERFTAHAPLVEHSQSKSIINPMLADENGWHMHFGSFNTDIPSVNSNGDDIFRGSEPWMPQGISSNNIHINHYIVKSAEEFAIKTAKRLRR